MSSFLISKIFFIYLLSNQFYFLFYYPMTKITLPLVMIASLTTLISCGSTSNDTMSISPVSNSLLTGSVVTSPVSVSTRENLPAAVPSVAPPIKPTVDTIAPQTTKPVVNIRPTAPTVIERSNIVSYNSPGWVDKIGFRMVVTDGIITSLAVTPQSSNDMSGNYQQAFASKASTEIVGKKIKWLQLDAVGWASLTTAAFEKFVQTI